nr:hypothetical protein [Acidobacteriota bacterium]
EALRDGNQPVVSIASGADDLRIVAAVYESAKTGSAVRLDEIPLKPTNSLIWLCLDVQFQ